MAERITEYERASQELLATLEGAKARVQERIERERGELADVETKIAAVKTALAVYREHHDIQRPDVALGDRLRKMPVRDMILTVVAEDRTPRFRANHIAKRLTEAGMFSNMAHAAGTVYSTLRRNKNRFIKIGRGVYQVTDGHPVSYRPSDATKDRPDRRSTGLVDAVLKIRTAHPEWDRAKVAGAMLRDGWVFGDSKPVFAVSAAFASIARLQKDRMPQPRLLSIS